MQDKIEESFSASVSVISCELVGRRGGRGGAGMQYVDIGASLAFRDQNNIYCPY